MPQPDALHDLGVRVDDHGGVLRVFSANATSIEVRVTDADGVLLDTVALTRGADDVWETRSSALTIGARYSLRVTGPEGPANEFDGSRPLFDPWARGIVPIVTAGDEQASDAADDEPEAAEDESEIVRDQEWHGVVLGDLVDREFDWQHTVRPRTPWDHTVIYEMHVRGFSMQNSELPAELRGTYAGLGHPASIEHLRGLGVTTVELLPVQAFVTEGWLEAQGRSNYWGYNTLSFFAPHAPYATAAAQAAGPAAVRREFAEMVRSLHAAGLEVILDVVYNHTAEEGPGGPAYHLRGIDNATYYRHDDDGNAIDTTGCGNTLDVDQAASARLVLDSMRYWAEELQVDGFRLDLAVTLGRTPEGFTPEHPLLQAMLADPVIGQTKLIAEPWDVGLGGWQTGKFPDGFVEWNDRYRDRMRDFWLGDVRREHETGTAGSGIGRFATRLAGSSYTFANERGPLASLNFITAHDGFTLADLTAYDRKHNEANGEDNRDGTDNNNSYNHGVEGPSDDGVLLAKRRRAIRNLLGTLLLSAGVPMLTAGDEYGRTQSGNNNAYCQDTPETWLSWDDVARIPGIEATVKRLLRLRSENAALRPARFGRFGETTQGASQMDWYNADGETMTIDDWNSPQERTLQYLAASTPQFESVNRILLVVHAHQNATEVVLPEHEGVSGYTLLWDSATEAPVAAGEELRPGQRLGVSAQSMRLFRAHGEPGA